MLSLLFLISSYLLTGQTEWTWSIHAEAGFKVLTPVALSHDVTEVPTETGSIQYHQYSGGSVKDTTSGLAFVIDHYQLPVSAETTDDLYFREFFETTVEEILQAVEGTLVYSDFLPHGDRQEYVWKATYHDGKGIIKGSLIVAGNKYYGVQTFGWKEDHPDDRMNRFINSFKLTTVSKT